MSQIEMSRETLIAGMVIEYVHTLQRLNNRPIELEKWDKEKLVSHFINLGLADELYMSARNVRTMSKKRIIEHITRQEIDEESIVERLEEIGVDVDMLQPLLKLYMPSLA